MYNLLLEIAYLGTDYSGSQVQKNSITIQGLLNKAVKKVFSQENIKTIFSGRTDAGVHACEQSVNVTVSKQIKPANLKRALNSLLPKDIRIKEARYVSLDFNARYSALRREYVYNILLAQNEPLFMQGKVWWLTANKLNIRLMKKAARIFKGKKDFTSFCAANSSSENKVRKVFVSKIRVSKIKVWPGTKKEKCLLLSYHIKADGFLYHMIRNIISSLVDVGLKKMTIPELEKVLRAKDRKKLKSVTAPAAGLSLVKVNY